MGRISLARKFTSVIRPGYNPSFGGNQCWFVNTDLEHITGQGCGLISAVDCDLYMEGLNDLDIFEYRFFVDNFLKETHFSKLFLYEFYADSSRNKTLAIGILPFQINRYLNKNTRVLSSEPYFRWNGIHGHKGMYEKIKDMLRRDIPVIWSLYSPRKKIRFYTRPNDSGSYIDKGIFTNSHYVTITGVIEDERATRHRRMVEISSWGQRFYVDYDEYLDYVGNSLISKYCSNIIYIK